MLKMDLDKEFTGKVATISGNVGNGKNALGIALIRIMAKIGCIHNKRLDQSCSLCDKYGISQEERQIKAYGNFHIGLSQEKLIEFCRENNIPVPYFESLRPNGQKTPNPNIGYLPVRISKKERILKEVTNLQGLQISVLKESGEMSEGLWVFIECVFLENVENFLKIPKLKQHCVCILDEPNAWGFDARGSMSPRNRAIGYKIQHCRHYNLDIIFLTQLWSMVDLRGKRLSADTIVAITPNGREFQYGLFKYDSIIPLTMRRSYARKWIYPFYDSGEIIGQVIEEEPEPEESELVIKE